ncbi:hypothetical protein [Leptospira kmetyi]|uniref:hypothetical protein n=1 Tax=Leptospira kmetyi TaxID=408139 RepID=UPI003EBE2181
MKNIIIKKNRMFLLLFILLLNINCKEKQELFPSEYLENYRSKEITIRNHCIYAMDADILELDVYSKNSLMKGKIVKVLKPGIHAEKAQSFIKESEIVRQFKKSGNYIIKPTFCYDIRAENVNKGIRIILYEYGKYYNTKIDQTQYQWSGEGALGLESQFRFIENVSEGPVGFDIYVTGKNRNSLEENANYSLDFDETPFISGTSAKVIFDVLP